jgi:PilZ domain
MGETENISASGALLAKEEPVDVGSELILELVNDAPPLVFRRLARVVRDCGRSDDGWFRMAVEFDRASPKVRAELAAALIVVAAERGYRARRL